MDTIPSILNKCLFVSPDKPKPICSLLFQSGDIKEITMSLKHHQIPTLSVETAVYSHCKEIEK